MANTKITRKKLQNSASNEAQLVFHAMYIMAAVDGKISPDEGAVLRAIVSTLPDFRNADVGKLLESSAALANKYGGLLASIEAFVDMSKDVDVRYRTFLLAAEVALASNGVNPAEEQLLTSLGNILGLDGDVREGILNVMAFKYAN